MVSVSLHDRPLGNGEQLLCLDVGPHHHGQHGQQLLLADVVIPIEIIHPEREMELVIPRVQFVLCWVSLHRSKVFKCPWLLIHQCKIVDLKCATTWTKS